MLSPMSRKQLLRQAPSDDDAVGTGSESPERAGHDLLFDIADATHQPRHDAVQSHALLLTSEGKDRLAGEHRRGAHAGMASIIGSFCF
jgi:hypothetical protein